MGSILHDYGNLIAPTAAILNGFIAVVVAQFFKDHRVAKFILVVAAGALGAAAIGATFYYQRQIVIEKTAEAERRVTIRDGLGGFIAMGSILESKCANSAIPVPLDEANQWASQIEAFLLVQLGNSYVNRFRDKTGIVPLTLNSADPPRNALWFDIYTRIGRLQEFSQQLPL